MSRPPNTGAAEREREALIRRLERRLADFQAVPPARREAECADEGEQTCRALLAEIGAPGHVSRAREPTVEVMTIDEWLDGEDQQST